MKHCDFLRSGVLLGLALCAACADGDKTLRIDSTGVIAALVYLDRDGDAVPGAADAPSAGVRLSLLDGRGAEIVSTTTDASGVGLFSPVPVGSYRIRVGQEALGDSVHAIGADALRGVAGAQDTALVVIPLAPPSGTAAQIRAEPEGKLLLGSGVALNAWPTYGDASVAISDSTGTLLVVDVPQVSIQAGDSVRVVGRTGTRVGQPVLLGTVLTVRGRGALPTPDSLATNVAAVAAAGVADAALVRIAGARIIDSRTTSAGDLEIRVDDGSGALVVVLDRHAPIVLNEVPIPGASLSATGILFPAADGGWVLKPRVSEDVSIKIPTVTVAEARALPRGSIARMVAITLSGWLDFGDQTLHLGDPADARKAIRMVEVGTTRIVPGDSIRVLAMVDVRDGQPILRTLPAGPAPSILGTSRTPTPISVTTAGAADADGGTLDATLVQIAATVQDTATAGADYLLVVDDGSGPVTVLLDRDTGIGFGGYAPGQHITATGVLVPAAGGRSWVLKPRVPADVVRS